MDHVEKVQIITHLSLIS